ncbi:MAG: hypothetical protein WCY05_01955 [Candidatus Omnitrophota bacterium]
MISAGVDICKEASVSVVAICEFKDDVVTVLAIKRYKTLNYKKIAGYLKRTYGNIRLTICN